MRRLHSVPGLLALSASVILLMSCSRKPVLPKLHTYALGERAEVGRVIYTAYESQWLTQIGQGLEARVPQNRYFLIRVSIANSGNSDLLAPTLSVLDAKGTSYPEVTDGRGVPQWLGVLRNVKPAEAAQGYLIFDAPPGHYKLLVADDTEEKSAYIDIPLTYNAETPEMPVPGAAK